MAKEVIHYLKKIVLMFFIIWIITFISLITMVILYIKLTNNIGVIETTTTEEVTQDNTNGNNNYIGNDGDITNGKANN
jgi:hypothetical protein